MSITYGFYNSLNGDRRYNAGQMSAIFDGIINDGIFQSIGTAFEVKALSDNTITVGIGRAWFNHTWTLNDAILPIEADISEVLLDRIDAVVLEVDANDSVRANSIKIIKGTPSSSPQNPAMIDDEYVHQHPFAYIYRKANSTTITQAEITSVIGTSECPFITGILETISIDSIVAQWEAQWEQWTDTEKAFFIDWRNTEQETFTDWREKEQRDFNTWGDEKRQAFINWFNELQLILNGEDATKLANAIVRYSQIETVSLLQSKWTVENGRYTQTVLVDSIIPEDMPLLLKHIDPDISKDAFEDYGIDFGLISGGQCGSGFVTFYATDILNHDITVSLSLGKKGDGRLLMGGGGSPEKSKISNVVITITDNAAIAEGAAVTASCNGKSWSSAINNGKAKLYASEVGNYTITVVTTDAEPVTYTTMLVCPYFGQFSTDIYSGTLVVTCTEASGNGKTCNVRSCDDEYVPTDAYNLTQTFDTALELTFLGIPAGKYLVTVDDKYVFFKEIASIQNVNSVNVQLRQYLYNHGDQCEHITGGWMKCNISKTTETINKSQPVTFIQSIDFLKDTILCSNVVEAKVSVSTSNVYSRSGFTACLTLGTKQAFPLSGLYAQCTITSKGDTPTFAFRSGDANTEATKINSPIILATGTSPLPVRFDNPDVYFVLGSIFSESPYSSTVRVTDLKVSKTYEISEIYLE